MYLVVIQSKNEKPMIYYAHGIDIKRITNEINSANISISDENGVMKVGDACTIYPLSNDIENFDVDMLIDSMKYQDETHPDVERFMGIDNEE